MILLEIPIRKIWQSSRHGWSQVIRTTAAKNIADRAIQVMGGYGYVGEYTVERLWRDAKLLEIGGGTLESHQKNITRDLSRSPEKIEE